jgi:ferredoxin
LSWTTASGTSETVPPVVTDPDHPNVLVPHRDERPAIDAVERCPGECIYLESDAPP